MFERVEPLEKILLSICFAVLIFAVLWGTFFPSWVPFGGDSGSAVSMPETVQNTVDILYEPEEGAELEYLGINPVKIEITSDDEFSIHIDQIEGEGVVPGETLINVKQAELIPREDYISVTAGGELEFARSTVSVLSEWGLFQIRIKSPGGKEQTIDAYYAIFIPASG